MTTSSQAEDLPPETSARPSRSGTPLPGHIVQLYETDDGLVGVVGAFLGEGLAAGEPLLVVARSERRAAICEQLEARGFDVTAARREGRLTLLDARRVLSKILVGGMPDPDQFEAAVGAAVAECGRRTGTERVRAYGEMVDLLWSTGRKKAAVRLEEMWNELGRRQPLSLLCAYAIKDVEDAEQLREVCATHADVFLPAYASSALACASDAMPPSGTVAAELTHRARVESILRESLRDLRKADDELRAKQRDAERVVKVTSAIANAVTPDQVYEAIVDLAGAAVGAATAALWLRDGDGPRVRLVRAVGYTGAQRERFGDVSLAEHGFPAVDAIARAEPVYIGSQLELLARYPHLVADVTPGRDHRIACLPIVVDGRTLGGLAFTFENAPPIDLDEQQFLTLAARYSGQAIERLRLLDVERQLRARAEAAASRMAVLNRATRLFSDVGTDLRALVLTLAEQIVVEGADGCAVVLFAEGDDPGVVAVHPPGHEVAGALEELCRSQGAMEDAEEGFAVLVTMAARGRPIGVARAVRGKARGAFTEEHRALFSELAERAAVVIERSRLYDADGRARLRAELLYGLARVVIGAEGIDPVMEAAQGAIERALSARRSAILVMDEGGVMRFRAFRGLSDAYRAAVEGRSPWPRDARAPEPVLVADVRAAPGLLPFLPVLEQEGIRALASIPLVAESRLLGKLMVYYEEPHLFTLQELEMARAIANHAASAITRFRAVAELRQTVRFNEMFTAILGHDLRNPLGAIMTAAQLAMKRYEDERLRKPLGRILSSGQRMARMIDQLLDFTRVRVGAGVPLSPKKADLLPLLRQVLDELDDSNPGFALHLEATGDSVGEWDPDRLGQVFSNLVGNAVEHGRSDAGARVVLNGSDARTVCVEVVNGGVIARELVSKLFEPMTGGEGRREKSQGLGLGLFITQQIVRAHGGTIDVHSSEEIGTVFRVVLPRAQPGGTGAEP